MPATIFSGTKVKALKSTLSLNDGADVISSTVDPTSVATAGNPGSILLNTTNGNMYRKQDSGSSTNWALMSSGGDAGINYITNGSAEANTTGWTTYADAAGTRPVDGTGGSPTVTFTRSTSSPLRGIGSFLITKDAANRQGEGASYDFTINSADKAQVLEVSLDYIVSSGTFSAGSSSSDSDLIVYLYDVTNASLIEPSVFKLFSNSSTVAGKYVGHFQTSASSTSYRLIFHVATTSASAYVLKVDNVKVGPQDVSYGSIIAELDQQTLTVGAVTTAPTKGTITVDTVKATRVGSLAKINVNYIQTSAGGAAGSGVYLFSLPNGLSADSAKLNFSGAAAVDANNNAGYIGSGYVSQSGGNAASVHAYMYSATQYFLRFDAGYMDTTGTSVSAVSGDPFSSSTINFAQNIAIALNLTVPIAGWGSNGIIGVDAETRVVSMRAVNASTQALTADTTRITATAAQDSHSGWDGDEYILPISGDYFVSLTCADNAGATVGFDLYIGGSLYGRVLTSYATSGGQGSSGGILVPRRTAGERFDLRCNSTITARPCTISVYRLGGPAAVAVSEEVVAHYGSSSTALGTSFGTIVHTSKEYDTHGSYNTSTGVFTCPIRGRYMVNCNFEASGSPSSTAANSEVAMRLYKNNSAYKNMGQFLYQVTGVGLNSTITGFAEAECNAGDTLEVRMVRNANIGATSPSASNLNNYVVFRKMI
jgi:hypothetical protein